MTSNEHNYYDREVLWKRNLLEVPAEQERITKTSELIPPDVRTILDAGCGNGAFINSLPNFNQLVGLDYSQQALKYVKTKAIQANIAALPFKSASFDLITCLEVLEHLPCGVFEKALSELQRVSKKYIIISVPNDEDLESSLVICPVCRCWYNPYRHVRSFNSENLKTLFDHFALSKLKEVGFLDRRPRYNRLLYAAYRLYRNAPPPSTAICPQCGHQPMRIKYPFYDTNEKSSGLISYALRWLKPLASTIWRQQWRYRWLLALYIRKDSEKQS